MQALPFPVVSIIIIVSIIMLVLYVHDTNLLWYSVPLCVSTEPYVNRIISNR